MSLDASLNIRLGEYRIMDIVGVFLGRGMSVYGSDNRAFIITSDDFDWDHLSVTFDELTKIIEDKERRGSPVCITLYENGEPVTNLLKAAPHELDIACDINRKTLDGGVRRRYTDVNHYIEKFIAPLEEDGFVIEQFEFYELNR
ncbi:MAG: hypothetical protein NC299_06400 [Lachnospiraceae bacterium]|nr:hypothetical protein [Ruminococcus sp.]MCM1274985.1 hypothetical protein [Lachnospiraceae bacterium]